MGKLRRFLYILYVLAGTAALLLLLAPWYGPWQEQARACLQRIPNTRLASPLFWSNLYWGGLVCALAISAVGLLVILIRAITAPSKRKTVQIALVEGGAITMGTDAIASQLRHILDEEGSCETVKVRVDTHGRDRVRIHASLRPYQAQSVAELGDELMALLYARLNEFTGGAVESIALNFLPAFDQAAYEPAHQDDSYEAELYDSDEPQGAEPRELPEPEPVAQPESQEVTLTGSALRASERGDA